MTGAACLHGFSGMRYKGGDSMSKFLTRKVIVLILAIVISASAVTGGTIAWFTDTVTSSGNVIQAGTLDVGLYAADTHNAAEADWKDVEAENAAPIFNYDKWEPGYTQLKYAKIVNKGNLAFKFHINVKPTNLDPAAAYELADVIDVYYKVVDEGFAAPASFADVAAGWTKAGSISELIEKEKTAVDGVMLGDQAPMTIALALHMQETADNNYQGLSVGEGFALELVATQYTKESDSFDDQYDAGATYDDGLPKADVENLNTQGEPLKVTATLGMGGQQKEYTLETAYIFRTTESLEEAEDGDHRYWHADFVVSADRDVPANAVALVGYYEAYCKDYNQDCWVALEADTTITAGTQIRLLEAMLGGGSMSYQELCNWVPEFKCGVAKGDGANDTNLTGTTLTVELRLYEVEKNTASTADETGEFISIGKWAHTFE